MMTRKNSPLVSVIIVNFNGKKYLLSCLEGVFNNLYPNYEVIVVDNGSVDGSVSELKKKHGSKKNLKVLELEKNFGPAYARNCGAEVSKGKYLSFLDNDTYPEKDWLVFLVKAMEEDNSLGACQCKLLLMKDKNQFDYAGDYLSQFGFLVQRVEGGEVDRGQADQRVEILSAKSAAMIIRKKAFEKAGGFDEDYFIYLEETDLGWRTWLAGFKIIFIPESRVYHEFGTSELILSGKQNYLSKFHGTKNYISTNFKNLGTMNLLKILPLHVFLWFGVAIWFLINGQFKNSYYVFQGILWPVLNISKLIKKRSLIQKKRILSDEKFFYKIYRHITFKYFYRKLTYVEKIGNAESWNRSKR